MKLQGVFVAALAAMKSIGNAEEVVPSFYNPNETRGFVDLVMKPYPLPIEITTYVDVYFNIPEDLPDLFHIVRGEVIISQPEHLHHFVLDGCIERVDESIDGIPIAFDSAEDRLEQCNFPLGAWAPGNNDVFSVTGLDTGVLAGLGLGIKSLRLNVHYTDGVYENPEAKTFKIATDGIRVHYTTDFRPYTTLAKPVIDIGDAREELVVPYDESRFFVTRSCKVNTSCKDYTPEMVYKYASYFKSKWAYYFNSEAQSEEITCQDLASYCNGSDLAGHSIRKLCPQTCGLCEDAGPLNPETYRITGINYHAHLLGREMYATLIREEQDSEIMVKDMQSKLFWINDFQETYRLDYEDVVSSDGTILRGTEVKPGDRIQATCVYDGRERDRPTRFGLSTYEEMCITIVYIAAETPDSLLTLGANASAAEVLNELSFLKFSCDSDNVYSGVLADDEDGRDIWKTHPISTAEGCIFPADDWTKTLNQKPICPNTTYISDMDIDSSSDNQDSVVSDFPIPDGDLVFVPFEPYIPCADGSPAGIYKEANLNGVSEKNHVIAFLGGGICANEESCEEKRKKYPFLFSSDALPQSLKGQTLFSRNATENIVSSDFTRWVVPYCTQDLYLGLGSDILEAALSTLKVALNESAPDTLLVAGISAGAIGLMNHIESVQKLSRDVNAKNLRFILDAVSQASTMDNALFIQLALELLTDFEKFPLCASSYTHAFQTQELWNIPCCISTHCMLENDPAFQILAQSDANDGKERMLIVDSIYDPYAILSTRNMNPAQLSDTPSISELDAFTSNILELGGQRRTQFIQSAYGSQTRLGKSILWAVTNVPTHGFVMPAPQIEKLRCGNNTEGLEVYGSDEFVCKEDGIGMRGELIYELDATAWWTTETWRLASVNGEPIRNIIHDFVHDETIRYGLLQDTCSGPACVPIGSTEPNPAQKLFVLNDEFTSISLPTKILLMIVGACLILTYFLRILKVKLKESDCIDKKSRNGTIRIDSISVNVPNTEKELLNEVSFSLPAGTITALIGPSGAGKSTLLNVLCGQLPDSLQGFQRDDAFESLGLQTSYLRQFGNSAFQNIELFAFLKLTAKMYGASKSELATIVAFLKRSFADRVGKGPNFGGIKIRELSGGQQRTVAIVTTMLTKPKLLLLDEPLSGLDSVSSLIILEFLRVIAKERSCAVLLTLHQPSDAILELTDKTLVLHGGRLVLNEKVTSSKMVHNMLEALANGEEVARPGIPMSSLRRSVMSLRSMRQGSVLDLMRRQKSSMTFNGSIGVIGNTNEFTGFTSRSRFSLIGNANEISEANSKVASSRRCRMKLDLWQIHPLMRRLQLEGGHDLQKIVELVCTYIFFSVLLRFNEGSPAEFLLGSTAFCFIPVFVYQPLLLQICENYKAHELELQDGRISSHAYMLANFFYTISMPLAAIVVSIAIGYGIFGWGFAGYLDQFLFAWLNFLVSNQIGRVLVISTDGMYKKVDKTYVFYAAYSICMSGGLVSPNKLPDYFRWLSFFSVGFWSISGSMLVHFEQGSLFDVADVCTSLQSCILQDGVFLARALGYTPTASIRLSYVVLISMFVVLFTTEYVLMVRKYGSKRQF